MLACVITNLSGFAFGALYVVLRPSKVSAASQRGFLKLEKGCIRKIRMWPANSDDPYEDQMKQPITSAIGPSNRDTYAQRLQEGSYRRMNVEVETGTPLNENVSFWAPGTLRIANPSPDTAVPRSRAKEPFRKSTATPREPYKTNSFNKTASYVTPSMQFSTTIREKTLEAAPPDMLLPPPRIRFSGASGYQRDSSAESSAMVQIGLRFSNANDVPRTDSTYSNLPPPPLSFPSSRPSSLARSSWLPSMNSNNQSSYGSGPIRDGVSDKPLPPNPFAKMVKDVEDQLDSMVYDSQKPVTQKVRVTSPTGVGYQFPSFPQPSNSNTAIKGSREPWV